MTDYTPSNADVSLVHSHAQCIWFKPPPYAQDNRGAILLITPNHPNAPPFTMIAQWGRTPNPYDPHPFQLQISHIEQIHDYPSPNTPLGYWKQFPTATFPYIYKHVSDTPPPNNIQEAQTYIDNIITQHKNSMAHNTPQDIADALRIILNNEYPNQQNTPLYLYGNNIYRHPYGYVYDETTEQSPIYTVKGLPTPDPNDQYPLTPDTIKLLTDDVMIMIDNEKDIKNYHLRHITKMNIAIPPLNPNISQHTHIERHRALTTFMQHITITPHLP